MKSLLIILLGIWFCWQFTDIEADATLNAIVAPVGLVLFAAWGVAWLAARFGGGSGGDGGFGDFGDSGGGGD